MNYKFERFELRPGSRALYKDGQQIDIQPKPLDILLFLLQNRDRAVSKDELIEAVWGDVNLSETALTRSIMKARRAVDDEAETQSVIKTVHGHGYQFVANVVEAKASEKNKEDTQRPNSFWERPPNIYALASALLVLVAAIAIITMRNHTIVGAGEVRIAILPFQNETGDPNLDWAELGLMSVVGNSVGQTNAVHIVQPRQTMNLIDEGALLSKGALEISDTAVEKLRLAEGATHIVSAMLSQENDVFKIQYIIISDGQVLEEASLVGDAPAALATIMGRDILYNFVDVTHARQLKTIETEDSFIMEAFARGSAFYLKGDREAARNMFKAALENDPDNLELRLYHAAAISELAQHDEAQALFAELADEIDGEANPKIASNIHEAIAYHQDNIGDFKIARHHRLEALKYAELSGDLVAIGKAERGLGDVAAHSFEFDEARQYYNRARATFQAAGINPPPGYLLGSMAVLEAQQGNFAEAEDHFDQLLERFKLEGDDQKVMYTVLNIGVLRYDSGKWPQAETYLEEALRLAREVNDLDIIAYALFNWGQIKLRNGQFAQAEKLTEEALQISHDNDYKTLEALSLRTMGRISRRRGDLETARRYFIAERDVESSVGNEIGVAIADAYLARVRMDEKDHENAEQEARAALNAMRSIEAHGPEGFPLSTIADARLSVGAIDEAISLLEEALAFIKMEEKYPVDVAQLHVRLGEAFLEKGDLEMATNHLRQAQSVYPDMYFTLRLAANLEFHLGNEEQAMNVMSQAKDAARDNWTDDDESRLAEYLNQNDI